MLITADTENQKRLGLFFLLTIEDKNKKFKKKMVVYCKMKTSSP